MQTKSNKSRYIKNARWYKFKSIEETVLFTNGEIDVEKTEKWRKEEKNKLRKKRKYKK